MKSNRIDSSFIKNNLIENTDLNTLNFVYGYQKE
jgi:hypothetical protein